MLKAVYVISGSIARYPRVMKSSDGALRYYEVSLVPHRTHSGKIVGFYAMSHDVTEQHTSRFTRAEDQNAASRRMARSQLGVDTGQDRTVSVPGLQPISEGWEGGGEAGQSRAGPHDEMRIERPPAADLMARVVQSPVVDVGAVVGE